MADIPTAAPAVPEPAPGAAPPPRDGWAVASGRGVDWWSVGWRLFAQSPWIWIAITVVFAMIMIVLHWIPFLGAIAATLLYPVLGAGVLVGARDVDRGGALTIGHLFACCNAQATPLVIVGLLYLAGWFVIWLLAAAILVGVVGLGTLMSLVTGDPTQVGLGTLAALGMGGLVVLLLAALLGVPLIMAYWFAPALVLFRGDEPVAAMKSSFAACLRNVPPFLVYSLLGLAFAIAASLPFFLGWLVLLPVYATSLYASYKDIFGAPA